MGVSNNNASPSKTQPTTTPLKKIEEMNETINSKKSLDTSKPPAAKTPTNGPPGISDISDSDSSSSSSDRDVFGSSKKQSGIKKQSSSDSNWLTPKQQQQQQQLVDLSDVEESATNSHSIGNLTRQFEVAMKPQVQQQQQSHSLQSSPAKGQLQGLTDLMRAERISRQSSVDSQQQQQKPPAHLIDLMKEERDRSNSAIYSVVNRGSSQGSVDSPAHLVDLMKAERSNSVNSGGVQRLQSLMQAEKISASSKQNSIDSLTKQPVANHLAELMREEKSQAASHHSSQQSLTDLMRFEKASRQGSIDSGASSGGGQKPTHLADLMREERSNSATKQQQQQSPSGPLSKQNSVDSLSKPQHLVDLMKEEKVSAVSKQQKSPPPPPPAVKGLKELIREERDAVMKSTSSVSSSSSFPSPPKPVPSQQTPTLGLKQLMREERTNVIHRTQQQQQQQTSHVAVANNGVNLFSTPPEGQ